MQLTPRYLRRKAVLGALLGALSVAACIFAALLRISFSYG